MSDNFFDSESANSMLMYWWHGVIVDDMYWAGCKEDDVSNEHSKIHYAENLSSSPKKGWGKRYKVAVVGRHYAIKGKPAEADYLEMAEVVYPVTAGSGLGGTKQTAALRQGAHVIGFYADGKEGRNPVILGCFGVNEQNEPTIEQKDPKEFFKLRTANKGMCGEKLKPVPEKDQNLEKDKKAIEANASPQQASQAHKTKVEDGNVKEPIYKPFRCEEPSSLIDNIKLLLEKLSYYINLAKRGASDLVSSIDGIIKSITRAIAGLTNTLLDRARGYVINLINNGVKDVMNLFPPFLRPGFNTEVQKATNGLGCAFNNIKDKVLGIVQNLAKQFIDSYLNSPLCAATSFLGGLLGNVLGEINGAVDTAVSAINSIINIGAGFADKALDVLDLVLNILGLFECDTDEKKCPDTKQWSFWNGPKDIEAQVEEGAARLVKNILDEVETVLPGSESGASSNPCNSRQVPCGPPRVQIVGGGGSGATANAVVNASGAILGLDFSSFGSGYTYEPQIRLADSCNTGGGAVFQPIMRPTGTFNRFNEEILDLVGAIPIDSGSQYLPAPNGTTGGAGFIFSKPDETILFKTGRTQIINGREVNGTGYEVYPCGTTFDVVTGDEVYLPNGTVTNLFGVDGEVQQVLRGLGPLTKIGIETSGSITAPCNPDNVVALPPVTIPISSGRLSITGSGTTQSVTDVLGATQSVTDVLGATQSVTDVSGTSPIVGVGTIPSAGIGTIPGAAGTGTFPIGIGTSIVGVVSSTRAFPQTVPGVVFTSGTILPDIKISGAGTRSNLAGINSDTILTDVGIIGTGTSLGFFGSNAEISSIAISPFSQQTDVQGIPLPSSVAVVAVIDQVFIVNPGFGFKSTDKISITQNKGSELEFKVNERGEVTSVDVIKGGFGFDEVPFISIQSETGFNFEAVAVFRFIPASSIDLNNITIPSGSRIISVVDCVGKYNE